MGVAKYRFIWGPGGAGKSHLAIRKTVHTPGHRLLLTLDPSQRLFHLFGTRPQPGGQNVRLGNEEFILRQTDALRLFEALQDRAPADPKVRIYFTQLVAGLQRFRDYLALIELGDEMQKDEFDSVIIDTPPFQEAKGFQNSIVNLHEFFDRSLVQLSLRNQWLQVGVRKVIEGVKLFTGKRNLEQTLAFLDWLQSHIDRFQLSARALHELLFHPQTIHTLVLTPESSLQELKQMEGFFKRAPQLEIIINRSVEHLGPLPNPHPFFQEFQKLQDRESALRSELKKAFNAPVESIPLTAMGEDTTEELLEFVNLGIDKKIREG